MTACMLLFDADSPHHTSNYGFAAWRWLFSGLAAHPLEDGRLYTGDLLHPGAARALGAWVGRPNPEARAHVPGEPDTWFGHRNIFVCLVDGCDVAWASAIDQAIQACPFYLGCRHFERGSPVATVILDGILPQRFWISGRGLALNYPDTVDCHDRSVEDLVLAAGCAFLGYTTTSPQDASMEAVTADDVASVRTDAPPPVRDRSALLDAAWVLATHVSLKVRNAAAQLGVTVVRDWTWLYDASQWHRATYGQSGALLWGDTRLPLGLPILAQENMRRVYNLEQMRQIEEELAGWEPAPLAPADAALLRATRALIARDRDLVRSAVSFVNMFEATYETIGGDGQPSVEQVEWLLHEAEVALYDGAPIDLYEVADRARCAPADLHRAVREGVLSATGTQRKRRISARAVCDLLGLRVLRPLPARLSPDNETTAGADRLKFYVGPNPSDTPARAPALGFVEYVSSGSVYTHLVGEQAEFWCRAWAAARFPGAAIAFTPWESLCLRDEERERIPAAVKAWDRGVGVPRCVAVRSVVRAADVVKA